MILSLLLLINNTVAIYARFKGTRISTYFQLLTGTNNYRRVNGTTGVPGLLCPRWRRIVSVLYLLHI
jgi:hypothetical protein